jgi:hypothetical protein
MPVSSTLQGIMITGSYAGRLFAMPTDSGKSSVFAQRGNPIILGMIEVIASYLALFTTVTDI